MSAKRGVVSLVATDYVQQWAARINRHLGEAVAALLATGRELLAAKKDKTLKHGDWERMFKGHPQAVKDPIPFSVSKAKMLMLVAEHPIISNRQHVNDMPARVGQRLERLEASTVIRVDNYGG